jgi:hypothetical protein
MGRPKGTGPSRLGSTSLSATITVASVGPYVFTKCRPADQTCAVCSSMASAPTSSVRTSARSSGSKTPSSEGTTLAACTETSRSRRGSARCSSVATTSVAPVAKATATSSTDASKANDANCNTETPGPAPIRGPNTDTRLVSEPCETATPFGVPVEPDV